jgi:hypothetical protein
MKFKVFWIRLIFNFKIVSNIELVKNTIRSGAL